MLHGGQTRFNGSHSELVAFAAAMAAQEAPPGDEHTPGQSSDHTPGESPASTVGDIAPEADAVGSTVTFSAFLSSLMAVHQEEGSEKEQDTPGGEASTKEAMAVMIQG